MTLVFSPSNSVFPLCLKKRLLSFNSFQKLEKTCLLLCRMANFRRERRGGEMRTCPQEVWLHNRDGCIYLFSPFLQAARAAAISFCSQEVYLVVGFLSFPVSFLQEDIGVFSVQQLIRRMLLLKQRQTNLFPVTDQTLARAQRLGLGVEIEEPDVYTYFPGAIFLPETLSLVGYNNNIFHFLCRISHLHTFPRKCPTVQKKQTWRHCIWHSLEDTL